MPSSAARSSRRGRPVRPRLAAGRGGINGSIRAHSSSVTTSVAGEDAKEDIPQQVAPPRPRSPGHICNVFLRRSCPVTWCRSCRCRLWRSVCEIADTGAASAGIREGRRKGAVQRIQGGPSQFTPVRSLKPTKPLTSTDARSALVRGLRCKAEGSAGIALIIPRSRVQVPVAPPTFAQVRGCFSLAGLARSSRRGP